MTGPTKAFWQDSGPRISFLPLLQNISTDVCVIGGGIAGMSVAYMVAATGRQVTVIDDGAIGGGETGRSTAHLSFALDDTYTLLQRLFGKAGARLAAESHMAAIDKIEEITARESIDCGLQRVNGYLFNPYGQQLLDLQQELQAARESGIQNIAIQNGIPLPGMAAGDALCFGGQAIFHPMRYLDGLAKAIQNMGARIYTHTRATSVMYDEKTFTINTQNACIVAQSVVVATNDPIVKSAIPGKNIAYRSYAVGMRCPKGIMPPHLFWDTHTPYYHMRACRLDEASDLLLAGGGDHRTGRHTGLQETRERFAAIEAWARAYVPGAGEVLYRWSGQVMEPMDHLAYIGRIETGKDLFVVTGGSGHGLTHGTIAGMIIADLLNGIPNKWQHIYDPLRPIRRYGQLLRYRLGNLAQWTERVAVNHVTPEKIRPGEGAIISHWLYHKAVYKDPQGILHQFSAICPYSGCVLVWNGLEHSWDCPCYGSRYDAVDGRVVNGPSNIPLRPI
ncbi:FAD-dependent oxidoreductase [Nemorincola caseinilytica]|uniref:FAD-dependent oxidoreductase n=1 Tax=Nemorincola caseinilytica TaxID=2054315 RepID=A0ABP8NMW8_9BACT